MPTKKIFLSDLCVGDIIVGYTNIWYPQIRKEVFPCFIVSKLFVNFNKSTFLKRHDYIPEVREFVNAGWLPAYGKFEGNSWDCGWQETKDPLYEGYHVYEIQVLISNPIHTDWNIEFHSPDQQPIKSKTYRFEETSKNIDVKMTIRSNIFVSQCLPEDIQIEVERQ
mgnify:CR=1 FL=1